MVIAKGGRFVSKDFPVMRGQRGEDARHLAKVETVAMREEEDVGQEREGGIGKRGGRWRKSWVFWEIEVL